jgi:DNA-binding CsgD family transcriptional regulator
MGRPILERDHEVAVLAAAVDAAKRGRGGAVIVSGEAGVGKSSLVRAALRALPPTARKLVGCCDDLATRRTLGPFHDLAADAGPELARAVTEGDDLPRVMTALRTELAQAGSPAVLVIEDVHWADDATLDVLAHLVRRIDQVPAVLVLTHRDDEVDAGHPLRRVLGQATGAVRRLPLARLTPDAVRRLCAGSGLDPAQVYEITGGNPFFVTELLAAGDCGTVPATVTDAVLARVARLGPDARDRLEQLAVVPARVDGPLVDRLIPGGIAALVEAERLGLLTVDPGGVGFRHELIRRTVADSLPAARRAGLNRAVLAALTARPGADLSRIVHHAAEAGDREAIARYGPPAARQAARARAHREAAAHYRLVLAEPDRYPTAERAALLGGYAVECCTVGDTGRAVEAQRAAVALRRALADRGLLGADLRWLSRMQWLDGDIGGAERSAQEAIAVVRDTGDGRLLALALSNRSQLSMLAHRSAESIEVGEQAIALARRVGDREIVAHALNNVGCARWQLGDPGGWAMLEEALAEATAAGAMEEVCRAYANLVGEALDDVRLDDAERYLRAGLDTAESVEHLFFYRYLSVLLGSIELARARWDRAEAAARVAVDAQPGVRCLAFVVLGRIRIRRGTAGGAELLDRAWELASRLGDPQWTGPAAAARAEAAWLRGDAAAIPALAEAVYRDAVRLNAAPVRAELGHWLTRAGRPAGPVTGTHPYALLAAGRWREAATAWRAARCPYEEALALAGSPDRDDLLAAVAQLDRIGAEPLARRVRARLRALGAGPVPRGPVRSTRTNPGGLTGRQLEVARLLTQGLTNGEIADRLVLSVRTAEHHVAAVLRRLGARDRRRVADGLPSSCQRLSVISTPNFFAAFRMRRNASSRSLSVTSRT